MSRQAANPSGYSQFLGPRYWPSWLGLGILRLIHALPYALQLRIGAGLGRLFMRLAPARTRIARINLELCFPDKSPGERAVLLKETFSALGMALVETAMSWWGSDSRIQALADIEGMEHLERALDSGQGVILITGHLTSMELAGHIISSHRRIGAMYRPLKNRLMDHFVARARGRRVQPLFPRDQVRTMVQSLRKGEAVWYGFDQNYGDRHAEFVPFFGVPAATITTTSRFAKSGRALVIPFFPHREADGRYRIRIGAPLNNFPSGNEASDTLHLNQLLEQAIRRHPEQYLWIHRRFKTRPAGEASPYVKPG